MLSAQCSVPNMSLLAARCPLPAALVGWGSRLGPRCAALQVVLGPRFDPVAAMYNTMHSGCSASECTARSSVLHHL